MQSRTHSSEVTSAVTSFAAFLPVVAIAILALFAKVRLEHQRLSLVPKPRYTLESASLYAESAKQAHFGFKSAMANLTWIWLLQTAGMEPLKESEGGVTWEYAELRKITLLEPQFDRAYSYGASLLSVLRRDKFGAKALLGEWARQSPGAWRPQYLMGVHLFSEMQERAQAAQAILKAASLPGAPAWLSSLGVRLLSDSGSHATALNMALELYPSVSDEEGQDRLRGRIRALRYSLLKSAWQTVAKRHQELLSRSPASLSTLEVQVAKELEQFSQVLARADLPEDLVPIFSERLEFTFDPKRGEILGAREERMDDLGIHRPGKKL